MRNLRIWSNQKIYSSWPHWNETQTKRSFQMASLWDKKFLNSLFQFHKCNPDTKFACESCTFISLSATELLTHLQSYHVTQRPLSCSLCVFKTTDESQLKSHVITEHEDLATNDIDELSSVICGQCGLMFSDELQCNSHMREHMYKCYKCNFESEREEVILKHKNMEHKLLSCVNNSNESLKGMRDFLFVNTVNESLLMKYAY